MAGVPEFTCWLESSSASLFPTPLTIGHACQHSRIFPAFLGCHSKSGQVWPYGVESIISKLLCRHYSQGELPPSYILGRSHSHPPGSKHGHIYLTYLRNQSKVTDRLNDLLNLFAKLLIRKITQRPLFHVSHPPVQTCGSKDILYF